MTLANHSSRTYMDEYDLEGLLTVLVHRIDEHDRDLPIYEGAHLALNIIRNHRLDTQDDFMQLFDKQLEKFHEERR